MWDSGGQWLGLCASTAEGTGSIPGGELRSLILHGVAKKKKKKEHGGPSSAHQNSGETIQSPKPPGRMVHSNTFYQKEDMQFILARYSLSGTQAYFWAYLLLSYFQF